MLNYPVTLTRDTNGTYLVDFADFPDAHSVGETVEEAMQEAVDGLITAVEMYVNERRPVPHPTMPASGQHTVTLPASETAKALLWNEMLKQKMRKDI